ncbi:hypothetical protein [Aquamicrobium zhengzhouense]|uniref:Uncharacterized protein n=1 Tax=Aquamicrobium zhengzhouense TaxID=2781738 RepID=A0ABS0SCF2_9HYPH|nr:hypothetical protein [Aquamicrobium zhengzhouense]MBI1620320.1 hypothetical protein [Aquamicrobium zhengzhouense]
MTPEQIEHRAHLDALTFPDGYIEFQAAETVRNLIRRYGFEGARQKVAEILMDEADRRPQ